MMNRRAAVCLENSKSGRPRAQLWSHSSWLFSLSLLSVEGGGLPPEVG